MKWHNNTKEEYIEAAKNSLSIAGMCKYLGRTPSGAGYYLMKKKIEEYNIDTSHFKGQGWNSEGVNLVKKKKTPDTLVFVENSNYQTSALKKRLIEGNYKECRCERCKRSEWDGEPIPLEVHHINGIHNDNRIENLQILCPNCHALTDNYCSKNIKKKRTVVTNRLSKLESKICPICGNVFTPLRARQMYCSQECSHKSQKRVKNIEELVNLFDTHTNGEIAKLFNITESCVRKYRKKYKK